MTQEKSDLRVRRTQKMLQEALIELVAERNFDAISVGDIAERAMVNRATFYRHYQDKYDLMEKIFGDMLNQMVQSIGPNILPVNKINFNKKPVHFIKIFEHIDQNHKIYEALLGPRGNPLFAARLRDRIMMVVQEREELREKSFSGQGYSPKGTNPPIEVVMACVANLLVGMISWWLENGRPYTPEQMASWVIRFMAYGYVQLRENQRIEFAPGETYGNI